MDTLVRRIHQHPWRCAVLRTELGVQTLIGSHVHKMNEFLI